MIERDRKPVAISGQVFAAVRTAVAEEPKDRRAVPVSRRDVALGRPPEQRPSALRKSVEREVTWLCHSADAF